VSRIGTDVVDVMQIKGELSMQVGAERQKAYRLILRST